MDFPIVDLAPRRDFAPPVTDRSHEWGDGTFAMLLDQPESPPAPPPKQSAGPARVAATASAAHAAQANVSDDQEATIAAETASIRPLAEPPEAAPRQPDTESNQEATLSRTTEFMANTALTLSVPMAIVPVSPATDIGITPTEIGLAPTPPSSVSPERLPFAAPSISNDLPAGRNVTAEDGAAERGVDLPKIELKIGGPSAATDSDVGIGRPALAGGVSLTDSPQPGHTSVPVTEPRPAPSIPTDTIHDQPTLATPISPSLVANGMVQTALAPASSEAMPVLSTIVATTAGERTALPHAPRAPVAPVIQPSAPTAPANEPFAPKIDPASKPSHLQAAQPTAAIPSTGVTSANPAPEVSAESKNSILVATATATASAASVMALISKDGPNKPALQVDPPTEIAMVAATDSPATVPEQAVKLLAPVNAMYAQSVSSGDDPVSTDAAGAMRRTTMDSLQPAVFSTTPAISVDDQASPPASATADVLSASSTPAPNPIAGQPADTGTQRLASTTDLATLPQRHAATSQEGPAQQVAVQLSRAAIDGNDRITIKLSPIELGQIDVRMEIGPDGRVQAVFAADRPQTLELLQRDAKQLERALQDSGLRTDSGSLNFNLRGEQRDSQAMPRHAVTALSAAASELVDVPLPALQPYGRGWADPGRLDIRV